MRQVSRNSRRGTILILTAVMMVALLGVLALAIDVGYVFMIQTELQRTADAAAMSAAWELLDEDVQLGLVDPYTALANAHESASLFAGLNTVGGEAPMLASQDAVLGYLTNLNDFTEEVDPSDPTRLNAVRIAVRRAEDVNGEVPLFFARALGFSTKSVQAEATAAFDPGIIGFNPPSDGGGLNVMPFALDLETWEKMKAGVGEDNWAWDSETKQLTEGSDDLLEMNLFPQEVDAPGNRGTVDIGDRGNSTKDIARQLLEGISAEDLAHHGGKLALDDYGQLFLNGDTGISAGVKDELKTLIGKPRVVMLFSEVHGNGNNATYTIVRFVGIRIVEVDLTGAMQKKRLMIQAAPTIVIGGIPDDDDDDGDSSEFVYTPVRLVR